MMDILVALIIGFFAGAMWMGGKAWATNWQMNGSCTR